MIFFLFRVPKFPIICNIDGCLVSAKDEETFQDRMATVYLEHDTSYYAVDSTGVRWRIDGTDEYISPTLGKKASKKQIIESYNSSKNCEKNGIPYSDKSLSSKRFDKIFGDIVELLETSP